jgi:hypothetical protein
MAVFKAKTAICAFGLLDYKSVLASDCLTPTLPPRFLHLQHRHVT